MNDPQRGTDHATSSSDGARLRALFDAAIDVAPAERAAWLASHVTDADERATVLRLLEADDAQGFLDTPAVEHASRLSATELHTDGLIGRQIGMFRIVRALGQGGMAAVFLGERVDADFAQQVAIKLLRRGLYSELEQRLFQRERQVLAALDHPNIARLIDGGVTDAGIPYLVMEHIDGVPITRYAEDNLLDVRGRVRLFLDVCRAVEAAHRNLIVHRDIKPSNVLVGAQGHVKLLDFGIAKLLEEDADQGPATVGVYTPDYAAPEQIAGGAITTATDVYGLGVLLHELLLGLRPDGIPTRRPSSRVGQVSASAAGGGRGAIAAPLLRRQLRGDLDNVVLKALDPEPQRRYASAGALADDLERYLDGRPVAAHPPTRLYRARKFVQRHRGGVTLTAIFVVAILASLGLALWQADVARHERDRASSVLDFLLSVFAAAAPGVPDAKAPTLRDIVADGQAALAADARLSADARTEIGTRLVDVQRQIGDLAAARSQAARVLDEAVRDHGAAAERTLQAARALGEVDIARADHAAVLATVNRFADREAASHDAAQARLLALGAEAQSRMAHEKEALADAQTALAWCAEARCTGQEEIDVNETLAEVHENAGRFAEAEAAYRRVLALKRAAFGNEHAFVASTLQGIAASQMKLGRFAEAEATAREGIAIAEKVYVRPHNNLAAHYQNLGILFFRQERFEEASQAWRRTLEIQTVVLPEGHRDLEATLNNLGTLELARENFAAAVPLLRRALASAHARGETGENDYAVTARNLGGALANSGAFDEGRSLIVESIDIRTRLFGANDARTLGSRTALAAILVAHATPDAALAECERILQAYAAANSKDSDAIALAETYEAEALLAAGRHDQATALLRSAIAKLSDKPAALRTRARALLDLTAAIPATDPQRAVLRDQAAAAVARLNFKPPSLTSKLTALGAERP